MSCFIKKFKISRYLETWLFKKSNQYQTLGFQVAFSIMYLSALKMQILLIQTWHEQPRTEPSPSPIKPELSWSFTLPYFPLLGTSPSTVSMLATWPLLANVSSLPECPAWTRSECHLPCPMFHSVTTFGSWLVLFSLSIKNRKSGKVSRRQQSRENLKHSRSQQTDSAGKVRFL